MGVGEWGLSPSKDERETGDIFDTKTRMSEESDNREKQEPAMLAGVYDLQADVGGGHPHCT